MRLNLSPSSVADYRRFLAVKSLPKYRFAGRTAEFPDEYAGLVGIRAPADAGATDYRPLPGLFDYQQAIAALACRKRRFAAFVDPGLGKTLIETEFARHAADNLPAERCVLIVTPLMVIPQYVEEIARFYGGSMTAEVLAARDLNGWLAGGTGRIGLTNWEALRDGLESGRLGGLVLDESSMLKSFYGKWGQVAIRLGRGLQWKLAGTGTPAPNDRIEYANHAVLLDHFPTVNSFLARFFVNRGQTQNRWELKPHALRPFYRALSHWCIFMTNPAVYGWRDNAGTLPPVHIHIEPVDLTEQQREAVRNETGDMFGMNAGGITRRSTLGQIAKGNYRGQKVETNKPAYIAARIAGWPGESTIVWCKYNAEQDAIEAALPGAATMRGDTPHPERQRIIADFKAGRIRTLITKPDILGFGLNLQVCTRMVFSGLQDSYEEFYQAVKRANRVGSTRPLNVHIPVTAVERPMVENVLRKAKRVQQDAEEQERLFREVGHAAVI
jgi:hypothetical protein